MIKQNKDEPGENTVSVCPGLETVSAYFDRELDADSPEAKHIEQCEACGRLLSDFEKLSRDIKTEMANLVPDDFAEHLKSRIRKKISNTNRSTISFPVFLRVAAMLAGAALIVLTLISDGPRAKPTDRLVEDISEPLLFLGNCDRSGSPSMPSSGADVQDSPIDMVRLIPVGTGGGGARTKLHSPMNACQMRDRVGTISGRVRQTWAVRNLETAESDFAKFAPSDAAVNTVRNKDGNLIVNIALTKKELACLVRKCSAAGFKLLSPTQPQPEQKVFAGKADDKVDYTAVLVQWDGRSGDE